MNVHDRGASGTVEERIAALEKIIENRESQSSDDGLVIGVFSGDLDRIIASFIIAVGAAAFDMEVNMFFTFWATAALRDPRKSAKKDLVSRMFGWMLPNGSKKLKLSQMNMGGIGPKMIRGLMRRKNTPSLEELIEQAGEMGVKILVCEMSMNLMGFHAEELIDYPNIEYCGVGTFIAKAQDAKQTFFL